jgi:hypothetical protein
MQRTWNSPMATSRRRSRDKVRAHRERLRRQGPREIGECRIFAVRAPASLERKTSRPAPVAADGLKLPELVEGRFADRYSPAGRLADASHLTHECATADASSTAGHYQMSHVPQVKSIRSASPTHSDSRAPLCNPLFFQPDRPAAGFFRRTRLSCHSVPAPPRNRLVSAPNRPMRHFCSMPVRHLRHVTHPGAGRDMMSGGRPDQPHLASVEPLCRTRPPTLAGRFGRTVSGCGRLRPTQFRVPDVRSPTIRAEAHRQSGTGMLDCQT